MFTNQSSDEIKEVSKYYMALDSAAKNGVTPWEDICTNIRTEENQMVCGGGVKACQSKLQHSTTNTNRHGGTTVETHYYTTQQNR